MRHSSYRNCGYLLLGFFVICLCIVQLHCNLYDPRVLPTNGPFFDGYYIRITDHDNARGFALLFGIVIPKHKSNGKPAMVSVLKSENNGPLEQYNAFPQPLDIKVCLKNNKPVEKNPDVRSPAFFTWGTEQTGYIRVKEEKTEFNISIGNINFRAEIGKPTPWGENGEGPQSWLTKLPLPLNWFVYSLASPVISYVFTEVKDGKRFEYRGKGFAHMEKNWGKSFPRAWFWIEGVSKDGETQFAGSGGPVDFGIIPVRGHLIGYRNVAKGIAYNFRPDNSVMNLNYDGCAGNLNITVRSIWAKLNIQISGQRSTFSKCLYGPEAAGFTKACVESYASVAKITVFKSSIVGYKLVEEKVINQAALEFGGYYVCNKKCHSKSR